MNADTLLAIQNYLIAFLLVKNAESVVENAKDEKKAGFKAALEEKNKIAEPVSLENHSGQFKLRIPKSLHSHKKRV